MLNEIIAELGAYYDEKDNNLLNSILEETTNNALFLSNLDNNEDNKNLLKSEIKECVKTIYLRRGTEHNQSLNANGENVTFIDPYEKLRENVRVMYESYNFPAGSIVDWRSNGSGVELNANTPDNPRFRYVMEGIRDYGKLRYNTIARNFPGPIGVPSANPVHFEFEPENERLFEFIARLYAKGEYYGMFTYHGTAGAIIYKPYNYTESDHLYEKLGKLKERNYSERINSMIANTYSADTTYRTSGLRMTDHVDLSGCGDLLRSVYPGVILVELSKMGGNPISPYGDIFGNYRNVIKDNLKAFSSSLKTIQSLEKLMYANYFEDVSKKRR